MRRAACRRRRLWPLRREATYSAGPNASSRYDSALSRNRLKSNGPAAEISDISRRFIAHCRWRRRYFEYLAAMSTARNRQPLRISHYDIIKAIFHGSPYLPAHEIFCLWHTAKLEKGFTYRNVDAKRSLPGMAIIKAALPICHQYDDKQTYSYQHSAKWWNITLIS